MPRKNRNEFAAGLFVIVVLMVTVGVVLWLGAADVFRRADQRAFFSVSEKVGSVGLAEGSGIELAGKKVGKIVDIRLQPEKGRALYVAEIRRRDVKIYADAEARVAQGLVGESKLIITDRGHEQEGLADGEHPVELGGGMAQALTDLSQTASMLRGMVETVREKVAPGDQKGMLSVIEKAIGRLDRASKHVVSITAAIHEETQREEDGSLLYKVHGTMDNVQAIASGARPKIDQTLTSVARTAERIDQYTQDDVADILAKLREANTEILKIARDFSDVSSNVRETVLLNQEKVDETIDNLTFVSANLKAASTEIRRNPWRLLYRPKDEELDSANIYDAARAFSTGAHQLDQALTKLRGLTEAHPDGIPADNEELQRIREHIRETFAQFTKAERELWEELEK